MAGASGSACYRRARTEEDAAIVLSIQNRGYATLGRIAAHLDRLSAGDESNAVLTRLDAVSLMTVPRLEGARVSHCLYRQSGAGNRHATAAGARRLAGR